mgnify:CR=1 FL=1
MFRIGTGFDVHAFEPGNKIHLCGVKIPFNRGLAGHSDADVALHALTDAILGALALGDIGLHFPDTEKKWENADSIIFLNWSIEKAKQRNLKLSNIDLTIISSAMTKGMTTFYLLHKTYIPERGETVLFHAAAGGVGQIFAQWANSIGAKVIGTVGSDEKIKIAEENGYAHVINYTKDDFSKKVMEITNNEGVPAVFDGVGKNTFHGSLACLKTRGMMVSFGNASGPLDPVNVPKDIQPKGLYLTRPSIGQYFTNRKELQAGADAIFDKVKYGKIKIKISKEYSLIDAKKAHADLEARKLLGPAILIP